MRQLSQPVVFFLLLSLGGLALAQPTVTVTAVDAETTEAGDTALVRFTRVGGDQSGSLVVQYLLEGTARPSGSGADYETDPPGVNLGFGRLGITIPADSSSVDMLITSLPDSLAEGDETIIVRVDPDAAYEVGDPDQATVTIIDDAAVITVTAIDAFAGEAGPDAGVVRFERTGGNLDDDLVIQYLLQGQALASGNSADYETDPVGSNEGFGRLGIVIPAGSTSRDMTITPFIDNDVEGPETVIVLLDPDSAYQVGTPDSATVTIEDNAAMLSITAMDNTASERGDTATILLERSGGDLSSSITASLVFEGTAEDSDYDVTPELTNLGFGSLGAVFPANVTLFEIEITPVLDSNESEGDETVVVRLNNRSDYVVDGLNEVTVAIESFVDGIFQNGYESLALKSCAIAQAAAKAPERFQDNGTTILDLESQMIWSRCAPTAEYSWKTGTCEGIQYAEITAAGPIGHTTHQEYWRRATADEMASVSVPIGDCMVRPID